MRIFYIIYKYRLVNICILWNNMQSLQSQNEINSKINKFLLK